MIRISNIILRIGERLLFNDLFWTVPQGSKVGLVGSNGAGKTTLLRAVVGEASPDAGSISIAKGLKVGYLPQDLVEMPDVPVLAFLRGRAGLDDVEQALQRCGEDLGNQSLPLAGRNKLLSLHDSLLKRFELLGGYSFDPMARKVLKGLGFAPEDAERTCGQFSGGWKMRIHLAGLLLSSPDILLLDEPTNHLDTESMEWLEGWLTSFQGTMIAVSHDRRFLDKLCTTVAELSLGRLSLYQGNFSAYIEERERRLEELRKNQRIQKEELARMEEFIERFRYKASKASQVQSRVRRIQKVKLVEIEEDTKAVHFRFPTCGRSGLQVLSLENVWKTYGEKQVLRGISLSIQRGEKIALVGANGAGKSTLSRILGGREAPSEGAVRPGYNVKSAYFSQESSANLDYSRTVWENLSGRDSLWTELDKRNLLGAFLFQGDDIYKPAMVLSGGEKSRLALLKLLLEEANFLVLDEPTNHLDMRTKDLFQRALLEYDGTMVIVSHDRYFLDNLVTKVVEIADGTVTEYPGNYSFFIEKRRSLLHEEGFVTPGGRERSDPLRDQKRAEAERRNELYRKKKKILDRMTPLEDRIGVLEKSQSERDSLLGDPSFLSDSSKVSRLLIERGAASQELVSLLAEWEALMSEMALIEQAD